VLQQKYGRVVRIAPNHISVADKDALPVVYSYGSATFEKSGFYHAFVADRPSVFSTVDRREHAQKRRLVSHAFSYEALQQFSVFIQANIEIFTRKLDAMCRTDQDVDLLTWLNYLTFDVLS
jgi:benzoate 4-monooxygenase